MIDERSEDGREMMKKMLIEINDVKKHAQLQTRTWRWEVLHGPYFRWKRSDAAGVDAMTKELQLRHS